MIRFFRYGLIVSILTSISQGIFAQSDYAQSRKGDQNFEEGRFQEAETSYRKAFELNPKASTSYNLANSMFLQDRIPEAIEEYKKAVSSSDSPEVKSKAYYNMGNAYFQNNEFEQSIKSYKEALKINPTDEDAKKNLMLALRQLKQQQQEEKKENQQQQQQQEQQQQQQQEQKDQQQNPGESPQQEEKKKEDVSKEEASEILKAIEREDQRVQEKLKKTTGKSTPPVKDW
jgi:Ca-activated chloride channel homolog